MTAYVNVNIFWGDEIVKQDNDVIYTADPKKMRFIKWGTVH